MGSEPQKECQSPRDERMFAHIGSEKQVSCSDKPACGSDNYLNLPASSGLKGRDMRKSAPFPGSDSTEIAPRWLLVMM